MDFYSELDARGILKQVTDPGLRVALSRGSVTLYCGFDPTSDSLHVGSLLPLLTLRRFQLAGHRVIAVVGGATGMIGDPSGKTQERSLLDDAKIEKNLVGIRAVISRFLDLKDLKSAKVVNNADWFKGVSYIDFLRDIGKHFTVNHMVAKESVRARLEDREHGISYTEFSYMLLQAYDFYVLNEREGCVLQFGGSDQWGNIVEGIDLIRRMRSSHDSANPEHLQPRNLQEVNSANDGNATKCNEVFGFTHPLVMKADGTKFGKTEAGTIWLDPARTSPYAFYQFFIQTADADVIGYLKFFTFLSLEKIAELETSLKSYPEKREAQLALAREMTRLVHGESELTRAEAAAQALFGTEIRTLDAKTLQEIFQGAPSTAKDRAQIRTGIALVDLLAETGLCPSKGAARKDLAGGGVYVNNERISDAATLVTEKDLLADRYIVLRRGKKNYHLVSVS